MSSPGGTDCHLLPRRQDAAAVAMALDDAQLELAMEDIATLRLYSWAGPNLTIGYFQNASDRLVMGHESLPWARRSTGGEALLHDREWTYCLALPQGHPLSRTDPGHLPRLIHGAIARGLNEKGFPALLQGDSAHWEGRVGLCFQHWTPGDLLLKGSKIMGSAQRRRKGCLLQHGGLLLGQSRSETRLLGLGDLCPGTWNEDEVPDALETWVGQAVGMSLLPATLDLVSRWKVLAEDLTARHSSSEWLQKR